jgi:hypothetical protein
MYTTFSTGNIKFTFGPDDFGNNNPNNWKRALLTVLGFIAGFGLFLWVLFSWATS